MPSLLEDVEFVYDTEAAILIEFDDGSAEPEIGVNRFWVPKSVIESDCDDFAEPGDIADIEVATWWAKQCDGLEEYFED